MVANVLPDQTEELSIPSEMLRPALLPDGLEPERRVVYGGISWDQYLAIDTLLGDERAGVRLFYSDGQLEIVTTSVEHERLKVALNGFIEAFLEERRIKPSPRGEATMRKALREKGAQPDFSWCIKTPREFPDLVGEVALTSGGLPKLETYRDFGVEEVWLWRSGGLEVYALRADGSGYDLSSASRVLPGFPISEAERCAKMEDWLTARLTFREALAR